MVGCSLGVPSPCNRTVIGLHYISRHSEAGYFPLLLIIGETGVTFSGGQLSIGLHYVGLSSRQIRIERGKPNANVFFRQDKSHLGAKRQIDQAT